MLPVNLDLALKVFDKQKVSFGRHETFALRFSWLSKGFHAFARDPSVFSSDDATVALGVGKNMVHSIYYWMEAAQLIGKVTGGMAPTPVGKRVFDEKTGFDPYLEDEATIWLVHWLIASNARNATSFYWFFNHYHNYEFDGERLTRALQDFSEERITARTAESSIKKDISVLLRMYAPAKKSKGRHADEDALDSPLALLELIDNVEMNATYLSQPQSRENLPVHILGFALAQLFQHTSAKMLPIEELAYPSAAWPSLASVFRLTEDALLGKLEKLTRQFPGEWDIRETAGMRQIYLLREKVDSMNYLEDYYSGTRGRKAA